MTDSNRMMTQSELLAALAERGCPITVNQLGYWKYAGMLPQTNRARVRGGHSEYPDSYVDLIMELVAFRHAMCPTCGTWVSVPRNGRKLKVA